MQTSGNPVGDGLHDALVETKMPLAVLFNPIWETAATTVAAKAVLLAQLAVSDLPPL